MAKTKNFRHPIDARNDEKIAALVGDHGPMGYGVYWMIIELLHSQEGMCLEYTDKRMKRLGAQVGMDREAFTLLLQDMIDVYELLAVADGRLISPINYTGRSKVRKKEDTTHAVIETPGAAPIETEPVEEPSPIPEGRTAKEMECHNNMMALVSARPKIKDHQIQPPTIDESISLYEHYAEVRIIAALDRLQQFNNPRASGHTVYDALRRLLDEK